MKPEITKQDDGTLVLKITVPYADVEKARKKVTDELSKHVTAPGFRKGQVPKKLADEKLPKQVVQEETLKTVVPDAYNQAIKAEGLQPIISPKLHIEVFEEGTDLVFEAVTALEPKVKLGDYKKAVKSVTAKSTIIKPGQKEQEKPTVDDVLQAALTGSEITVAKILVEEETNRLLTQLVDELQRLGMTLDQYLSTRSQTAEEMRSGYEAKARRDLQLEFLLKAIADTEKIVVADTDIQDALSKFQDAKNREEIAKNPYFLVALIRQQKTIDYLMGL
ncbi:MAG TPA: trigger factor [Candidatus Levybacteria bacterium]|nr:trigger factor [Candidatus Levybacteria bacterium]